MNKLCTFFLIASALVAAAILPACSPQGIVEQEPLEGVILYFSSDDIFVESKATTPKAGEDAYNENVLKSVEYFLYTEANPDGPAVLHGYLENVRQNAPIPVPMTDNIVNQTLCPNNARFFYVYAIANHPRIIPESDTEDLSGTAVATLEAKTRNLEFEGEDVKTPQTSFLMSTDGLLQVGPVKRRSTEVASARVELKRVAAKISVLVRVEPFVEVTNEVTISGMTDTRTEIWRPRMEEMRIYLVNGAKTGQISGAPVTGSSQEQITYQEFTFDDQNGVSYQYDKYEKKMKEDPEHPGQLIEDLDANGITQYERTTKTGTFYPCEHPFYTYPEEWEFGTDEEPYLKLIIPWDRDPGVSSNNQPFGASSKEYYYRVYCPATEIDAGHAQFLRNNWYKVLLNVSILGSETDGGHMIINGQYYVVDWQEKEKTGGSGGTNPTGENDTDKEAEIKGARYIFVNENHYTLYNLNELSIPYVTSDPCVITDFKATRYNYSGTTKVTETITDPSDWTISMDLLASGGAHIRFYHALNNDTTTSDYDVSPYTFSFRLKQADNDKYYKDITIVQYPAIMIDSQLNSDEGTTSHNGYIYIDTNNSTSNTVTAWKRVSSLTSGMSGNPSNSNPNMYIITTSVLSDPTMLIGDPRTTNSYKDTDLVSSWTSTSSRYIDGTNNHRLTSYYPASSDEAYKDVIAPTFRVASSYGKSSSMTYDDARRRCASYQEDGYPAGRWRLPTMAEVLYITTLSADGRIPELFTFDSSKQLDESYWCASGKIDGVNGKPTYFSGTSGNRWIRCVYDEWYWSGMKLNGTDVSRVTISTFTWGDIPR